jgi:hypothetical protein
LGRDTATAFAAVAMASLTQGANVSDADEFRKQADAAREMAAFSSKEEDKTFWLRFAEDWIKLAREADQTGKRLLSQDDQNPK